MNPLKFIDAQTVERNTPWPALTDALRNCYRHGNPAPERVVHHVPTGTGGLRSFMLMPAWTQDGQLGAKLITASPQNPALGYPAICGIYVLFDKVTGAPTTYIDAAALTARRTAAVAALATDRLAAPDATRLLVVGTGRLASEMVSAVSAVRPLDKVMIWGRNGAKAIQIAESLKVEACEDLAAACRDANIICSVTSSHEPLILGANLHPGCHVNLIGAHQPEMRETDGDVFNRADAVFVDTLSGARHEAGDIIQAVGEGCFDWEQIAGDLKAICDLPQWPRHQSDITVFKSVGSAEQDLATALLCDC